MHPVSTVDRGNNNNISPTGSALNDLNKPSSRVSHPGYKPQYSGYSQGHYPVDSSAGDSSRRNLYDPQFLQYCQACVNKKVQVEDSPDSGHGTTGGALYRDYHTGRGPHNMADRGSERGCCGSCSACILSIPAGSLSCWILLAIGLAACTGSLYVAADRTRDWLGEPDTFLYPLETVTMSVLGGMVFTGILFLLVATLVSTPLNKAVFNTSARNTCGRGLNTCCVVVIFACYVAWLLCLLVLTVPVLYFVLLHVLYKHIQLDAINLRHYGLFTEDRIIQGKELDLFYTQGQDVFLCYIIAIIGAFLVVISLTCYLMCAAANAVYMKEARYSVLNAYGHHLGASQTEAIDTRM